MVKADGGGRRGVEAASQGAPHRQRQTLPPPSERRGIMPSQGASQQHRQTPSSQPSQREHDDEPSQTPAVSIEEINKLVSEVMRHMLFKSHQQPGVPVRRDELTQLISKTYKQRYLPNTVISAAQKKMLATFGFEMKEFNRMRTAKAVKASNGTTQADAKEYVLRTTLSDGLLKKYIETPDTAAVQSFAVLVVGIIKICGGERVSEEVLWQNLRRLGIHEEGTDHPVFGNIKNALDKLGKQRYIQKEKSTAGDGDGYVYELAERALEESLQSRLDEFMAKIVTRYNAPKPEGTPQ